MKFLITGPYLIIHRSYIIFKVANSMQLAGVYNTHLSVAAACLQTHATAGTWDMYTWSLTNCTTHNVLQFANNEHWELALKFIQLWKGHKKPHLWVCATFWRL